MTRSDRVARVPLRVALRRTVTASVVTFALLMGLLSVRMAIGNDPSLTAKATDPASSADTTGMLPTPVPEEGDEGEGDDDVVVLVPSTSPDPQPAPTPAPVQTTAS